jgi:hypothetical protein
LRCSVDAERKKFDKITSVRSNLASNQDFPGAFTVKLFTA